MALNETVFLLTNASPLKNLRHYCFPLHVFLLCGFFAFSFILDNYVWPFPFTLQPRSGKMQISNQE